MRGSNPVGSYSFPINLALTKIGIKQPKIPPFYFVFLSEIVGGGGSMIAKPKNTKLLKVCVKLHKFGVEYNYVK